MSSELISVRGDAVIDVPTGVDAFKILVYFVGVLSFDFVFRFRSGDWENDDTVVFSEEDEDDSSSISELSHGCSDSFGGFFPPNPCVTAAPSILSSSLSYSSLHRVHVAIIDFASSLVQSL
jgi:hypothetical protein